MRQLNLTIGLVDASIAGVVVPVASLDADGVASDVHTVPSQVLDDAIALGVMDRANLRSDGLIKGDIAGRDMAQVVEEGRAAGEELLVQDSLGLNMADLLGDYPLVVLSDDCEILLDDLDALSMADNSLFLDNRLGNAREVINAIEVIKARNAEGTVERGVTTTLGQSRQEGRDGLRGSNGGAEGQGSKSE